MSRIERNLQQVLASIRAAELQYSRKSSAVQLLAVSKRQSVDKIKEAYLASQRHFGESYLQEALQKMRELRGYQIIWHFIGRIQTNKTRQIAQHFSWVHSITHYKIAKRLSEQRPTHLPDLNICLEVNIDQEASKIGLAAEEVFVLGKEVATLPKIKLRGLMALPAYTQDFSQQEAAFLRLNQLQQQLNAKGFALDTLSMGTSHDFIAAIAAGSTWVRIGQAIFGVSDNSR